MARSILSFGMLALRAAAMAERRRGFCSGSGAPSLAATWISRASRANCLARLASWAPLRYMMFLNWEWPAMARVPKCVRRRTGLYHT